MKIEEEFSLFVVSGYICGKRQTVMGETDFNGITFTDTLQDFNTLRYAGHTIHILCSAGNMGFTFQNTRYNIARGDYVILPNA